MELRNTWKKWRLAVGIAVLTGVAGILAAGIAAGIAEWRVRRCADDVYSDWRELPVREYGLLLGTARMVQGRYLNPYFRNRIEAAVRLYKNGKIQKIIASGDNRRKEYNEPEDMRAALLAEGVPDTAILLDYAGFRTLDSTVRAKTVFNARNYIVISQRFHCERALYLARAHGIDAMGFAARDVPMRFRVKRFFREPCSRVVAWLDVNLLNRKPYFEK